MHDALGEVLANRRVRAVLPHVSGRLLDVGCGSNRLVRHHANGIGVDVHPWPGADVIVTDTATLQWQSASFDTVTIVAALNHIPNRAAVLVECRRVLRPGGRVIITMLTPRTSRIWHWIRAPWDADQRDRGMQPGEVYGFTSAQLVELFGRAGFALLSQRRFMLGLNCLYIFGLADAAQTAGNGVETDAPTSLARVS
jgi:SAM-dependent methyltransferase